MHVVLQRVSSNAFNKGFNFLMIEERVVLPFQLEERVLTRQGASQILINLACFPKPFVVAQRTLFKRTEPLSGLVTASTAFGSL